MIIALTCMATSVRIRADQKQNRRPRARINFRPTPDHLYQFRVTSQKLCVYLCVDLRKCLMLSRSSTGSNPGSRTILFVCPIGKYPAEIKAPMGPVQEV